MNCKHNQNGFCRLYTEPNCKVFCVEGFCNYFKMQTNADRIRGMSDEELAEFLQDIPYFTHDALMVWLKEEVTHNGEV